MKMFSSCVSTPLTHQRLAELLQSPGVTDASIPLLRWLIWFPLLSIEELTRLEQARLARHKQSRSYSRIAALLHRLEVAHLLKHIVVNEPGWPTHQHRYYITDAGLYVFAAQFHPPLSVPKIVQAYAIDHTDLIARLARLPVHLVLADFVTRLVAEGIIHGYSLESYQQPWVQSDTVFGRRQTIHCDAAFLISHPQGMTQAYYVQSDPDQQKSFDEKRIRLLLHRLLDLRQKHHLQRDTMPNLLIITHPSHLVDWAHLLEETSTQRGTRLLDGAITTVQTIQSHGVYGTSWWTFSQCVDGQHTRSNLTPPTTQFTSLPGNPASPSVARRFSQHGSLTHLQTKHKRLPKQNATRPLPSYIGHLFSPSNGIVPGFSLVNALQGTKKEQMEATAFLNVTLSAMQKEFISWLTHHPLLTIHHLTSLHHPGSSDTRGVQRQMNGLLSFNFLVPWTWYGSRSWQDRERYVLAASTLRYSALREGKQETCYLLLDKEKKRNDQGVLSIQHGVRGLFAQMDHTHGLYNAMCHLIAAVHREKIHCIQWKSAREALRSYQDPTTGVAMQIRPDAELIYQREGTIVPQHILIEYDRATTSKREWEAKYWSYVDYQKHTGLTLPPIFVITLHQRAATFIRTCVNALVKKSDTHIAISIILEEQLQRPNLANYLP